jgi:hypothetical protein
VGGKNGDIVLATPDGCLGITADAISPTLNFNAYNSALNTSGMVANNISGALAWNSANAYAVGAVVISSGTTYVCLTAQPASSPAPTNGAGWQSIGGGGGGGGNWNWRGAWSVSNTYAVNDVVGGGITADASFIMYIATTTVSPGLSPPWGVFLSTNPWLPIANQSQIGYNTGAPGGGINDTTAISMAGVASAPAPTSSPGDYIMTVVNNDGDLYTDFCAGRFVVAGINSGNAITPPNTLPFITTTGNNATTQLSINGGGNQPVNIVGGLTVNGSPVSGGGNWSYKGVFNTTVATAYIVNDVVFDTVNTAQTYVCILGYTTTVPTPTPPSANATNWLLLATNSATAGGSSITNTGATLGINTTGTLSYTTPNTPSFVNQINLTTTVPTTTPGAGAGNISITAGGNLALSSPNYVSVFNPTTNYATGGNLMSAMNGAWNNTFGYLAGQVAQYNNTYYLCVGNKSPPTPPATNPTPDVDTGAWQSLGADGNPPQIEQTGGGSVLAISGTGDLTWTNSTAGTATNEVSILTTVPAGQTSATAGRVLLGSAGNPTLEMNSGGDIIIQNVDTASASNTITIQTVLPTTTPPSGAGDININAGGGMVIQVNPGGSNLAVKNDEPTGDIEIISRRNIYLDNSSAVGSADVIVKPNITGTGLSIQPPPTYATGVVPYNTGVWSDQSGYLTGSVVQETAGGASFVCITQVLPNTTIPYNPAPSATPTSWLPLGAGGGSMELASGAGAVWSPTAGYPLGAVVNNTSPTGIWVCIQTVPTPAPPATNPNPTSSPTFWTELVSNTTAPGSAMMFLNTWSNASAYVAQEVVIYNGLVYVCILAVSAPTAPAVNPNPDASPANWLVLSNNPVFPVFDATGATGYPLGSIVQYAGVYYYALASFPASNPPVPLPTPVLGGTWAVFTTNVINKSVFGVADPFPDPTAGFSTLELIPTDESQTATIPTTSYTGNNGATGFVTGGTPYALVPGRKYKVSWDMLLNGIISNANQNVARYTIYLGFDASVSAPITALPTTYYELAQTGDVGALGLPIPTIEFSGELNFTAPLGATVLSFIVKNELIIQGQYNDPGFPAVSTTGPFLSFGFKNASSGLNITAYS